MTHFEAEHIVAASLKRRGASCKFDTRQSGANNIVATWKSTNWRILVKPKINELTPEFSSDEITLLTQKAIEYKQTAVLASVHSDQYVEFRAADNGKVMRPRSIIKVKREETSKSEILLY
jgi:hypothetical protein